MSYGQYKVSGYITDANTNSIIPSIEVFDKASGLLTVSDDKGYYEFTTQKSKLSLVFYNSLYELAEYELELSQDRTFNVILKSIGRTTQ